MTIGTITPKALAEKHARGEAIHLIDVRTPIEFREVHCEWAKNVPLHELNPQQVMQQFPNAEPLYIVCKSGGRGKQACEKFLAAGYTNVINVEGGTQAIIESGLPVQRGKKAISLERQVRIVAGSIVVLGTILGFTIDSSLHGLSAFIGAGLVFAGLTDTCGMGMVLARMPWNKVPTTCNTK